MSFTSRSSRRHSHAGGWRLPRRAPLLALGLACVWLVANVRHPSPIDVLPFVWVWLTLWLTLSILHTLARWSLRALGRPR